MPAALSMWPNKQNETSRFVGRFFVLRESIPFANVKCSNVLFLLRQEKYQKKATQGDIPKRHVPLRNPCAASPASDQKCSDFWPLTFQNIASFFSVDTRKSEHFRVSDGEAAGGVHRGGRIFVAPPLWRILWLLSWRNKKVTLLHSCLQKSTLFCTSSNPEKATKFP